MDAAAPTITRLLRDWQTGRNEALDELMPMVYERLRAIAVAQFSAGNAGHTMSATALVHEEYLRLLGTDLEFQDRRKAVAACSPREGSRCEPRQSRPRRCWG